MLNNLSSQIWEAKAFQVDLSALVTYDVASELGLFDITTEDTGDQLARYNRLARSASIFAHDGNPDQRDAAYRIAVSMIRQPDYFLGPIALHLLEKLGNFPAIHFGFGANLPLEGQDIRSIALLLNHLDENHVQIAERGLTLTNFQKKLWNRLNNHENVVVSAPTSSGKSFVVQHYLAHSLLSGSASNICYIVPSRALINQVSADLKNLFLDVAPSFNYRIVNVPATNNPDQSNTSPTIYVLTQERLHLLLDGEGISKFDILVVDEAQSIADGARGILLYSAISRAKKSSNSLQQIYICPFADIEKSFPGMFPDTELSIIQGEEGAVAQNLIRVDIGDEPSEKVDLYFLQGSKETFLGRKDTTIPLLGNNYAAALASEFGGTASNLIYAGGPARCETIATQLSQAEDNQIADDVPGIEVLADFLERAVHPKFTLASVVRRRIGFHYGRLPSIVRREIERAFSSGTLRYLVTTSTLLHGVNLPARNLFIDKPIKGKDELLTGPEFWNLVGRAGRLGKEFEGNIFLINLNKWEQDLTKAEKKYEVTSALSKQILDNADELIEFITDFEVVSGNREDVENAATKLYMDYASGELDSTLNALGDRLTDSRRQQLVTSLAQLKEKVSLDHATIQHNQTISVSVQQRLKDYLIQNIIKNGPARVMPLHPLSDSKQIWPNYIAIFKRIHTHIERRKKEDKSHTYFAPLAIRWMRGDPLPKLIDSAIRHKKKDKEDEVNISSTIRETLRTVEQDLRFRYVKYLSCYASVLAEALRETGNGNMVKSIPNLALYMEMGASSPSMLGLLELGVSRVTAALAVSQMLNKNMSVEAVRQWLKQTDLNTLDLPGPSVRELMAVQQ